MQWVFIETPLLQPQLCAPPLLQVRVVTTACTVLAEYVGNALWADGCIACAITLAVIHAVGGVVI